MSIRWCGILARVARSGFAVPISMPRYTWAESTLTISNGNRSASSRAMSDLPAPVGPISKQRAPAAAAHQRPRMNNRSRSPSDSRTHVGRPWLHWSARARALHFAQQRVHFRQGEIALGAHRGMAGHGAEQAIDRLFHAA